MLFAGSRGAATKAAKLRNNPQKPKGAAAQTQMKQDDLVRWYMGELPPTQFANVQGMADEYTLVRRCIYYMVNHEHCLMVVSGGVEYDEEMHVSMDGLEQATLAVSPNYDDSF